MTKRSTPRLMWQEERGVIRLGLMSRGLSGPLWQRRFQERGDQIHPHTSSALSDSRFEVTEESVPIGPAIIRGSSLRDNISFPSAHEAARRLGLKRPRSDVACHVFELIGPEDMAKMGLMRLVFMHDNVFDDLQDRCRFQIVLVADKVIFDAVRDLSFVRGERIPLTPETGFVYADAGPEL